MIVEKRDDFDEMRAEREREFKLALAFIAIAVLISASLVFSAFHAWLDRAYPPDPEPPAASAALDPEAP